MSAEIVLSLFYERDASLWWRTLELRYPDISSTDSCTESQLDLCSTMLYLQFTEMHPFVALLCVYVPANNPRRYTPPTSQDGRYKSWWLRDSFSFAPLNPGNSNLVSYHVRKSIYSSFMAAHFVLQEQQQLASAFEVWFNLVQYWVVIQFWPVAVTVKACTPTCLILH